MTRPRRLTRALSKTGSLRQRWLSKKSSDFSSRSSCESLPDRTISAVPSTFRGLSFIGDTLEIRRLNRSPARATYSCCSSQVSSLEPHCHYTRGVGKSSPRHAGAMHHFIRAVEDSVELARIGSAQRWCAYRAGSGGVGAEPWASRMSNARCTRRRTSGSSRSMSKWRRICFTRYESVWGWIERAAAASLRR